MADLFASRHGLLFDVRRSVRYHQRRRAFYESWNTIANAVAVIFSSAAIAGVVKSYAWLTIMSGAIVTVFSTVNLVVGTVRKARVHEELAKRFFTLERDIVQAAEYDEAALAQFTVKRLEIEADEPPILKVLDCICHNELARAMGYGEEHFMRVGNVQRLLRHFFDFQEHKLRRAGEPQ